MPAIIPKRVITVAGAAVEIARSGSGPSIVLINGAGGPIEGWMRVFDPLSAFGTVVAYNRAGIGKTARHFPQLSEPMLVVGAVRQAMIAAQKDPADG